MMDNYSNNFLKAILEEVNTIALVGASSNPKRDSFVVMESLLNHGYEVFPVNPNEKGNLILGQQCYESLDLIKCSIDMVDIFRAPEAVLGITQEAIKIDAKVIWMQLEIINNSAAKIAENAGLKVVMNRCPKIELAKPYWTSNQNYI
ncbi:CoA-binding protein [Gammaproteobacteria bacterium]|nr:CoA-binding protein [Gammaproteobacteria bacterium]